MANGRRGGVTWTFSVFDDLNLLAPKFLLLYVFVASVLCVHLRGRVRHRFYRQLTDYSTLHGAVQRVDVCVLGGAESSVHLARSFPAARAARRQLAERSATRRCACSRRSHPRAPPATHDLGFNSFFRRGWKRFYVKWYGEPLPSAKALCPRTVELVQSIPSINAAMFALLAARRAISVATAIPSRARCAITLGSSTPNSDRCAIWVDGERYSWRDGQAVVFDETFMHWAENKTDTTRLILFCDVERPLRSRSIATLNHWIKATAIRATQTENAPGEQIGALNRVFSFVYYLRLPGKALKKKSRFAYYAVKWLIIVGILYLLLR